MKIRDLDLGATPINLEHQQLGLPPLELAITHPAQHPVLRIFGWLAALLLLAVGWNFLFTGSTTLAMQAYRPAEKDRAQAAINFGVFATMAFTSAATSSADRRAGR
jgi:hypothetical protein